MDYLKTIRSTEESPHLVIPEGHLREPVGFTVPLLKDQTGNKFGKSAGNAIWLDAFKTTPFDMYGYFLRRPDDEVEKLLKLFTFASNESIAEVMAEHTKDQRRRVPHHLLAFEVLSLVHGPEVAVREQQQHSAIFGKTDAEARMMLERLQAQPDTTTAPTVDEFGMVAAPPLPGIITPNNAPRMDVQLPRSIFFGESVSLPKILHAASMVESRSEGQRAIKNGGIYIAAAPGDMKRSLLPGNLDWTPAKLFFAEDIQKFIIDDKVLIIRRGKHHVRILEIVTDEEYEQSGKQYPGQPYKGAARVLMEEMKRTAAEEGVKLNLQQVRKEARASGTIPRNPNPHDKRLRKKEEKKEKKEKKEEDDDDERW